MDHSGSKRGMLLTARKLTFPDKDVIYVSGYLLQHLLRRSITGYTISQDATGSYAQGSVPFPYRTVGRYLPLVQEGRVPVQIGVQEHVQRQVDAPVQRRVLALEADRDLLTAPTRGR